MQKELEFVCFDEISLSLMQKIAHKDKLVFLTGGIESDFHKIMDAEPESIVLGSDEHFIQKIYPSYMISQPGEMEKIIPFKTTLFQSSFYYNDQLYENIKIPELFLPRLEEILNFLESKTLSYDIGKCEYTSHFYPVFVTKRLQIKPFGSTPTTLIVTQRADDLAKISNYMKQKSAWSKQICFLPKTIQKPECNHLQIISYQKLSEICRLKEIEFNFAIINADLTEIIKTLKNLEKKEQLSLF